MSTTLAPNDPLVTALLDPELWDITSGRALTINAGARLTGTFTGTSLRLGTSVSPLSGYGSGYYPFPDFSIDGGARQRAQLTSGQTEIVVATGLADTTHTLDFWIDGLDETNNTKLWNGEGEGGFAGFQITNVVLDTGKTIAPAARFTRNCLVLGDSITVGAVARAAVSGGNYAAAAAARLAWPALYAASRSYNLTLVGFAGQPLATSGIQDVPALTSSVSSIRSGVARPFSTTFHEVIIPMGTNDYAAGTADATVTAAMESLLATLRGIAAIGSTARIRVLPAPGGYKASAIATGVANYLAAHPGDRTTYYDVATASAAIVTANHYGDGVHPSAAGQSLLADLYLATIPRLGGNATATSATAGSVIVAP